MCSGVEANVEATFFSLRTSYGLLRRWGIWPIASVNLVLWPRRRNELTIRSSSVVTTYNLLMRLVLGIIAVALLLYVLKRFPTSRWILAAVLCIPLVFIFGPHEFRHWYQGSL